MKNLENTFLKGVKGRYEMKIVEREWGIERVFKSFDGVEHSFPESLLFSSDVD